jgi:hypothetical protein
VLCKHKNLLKLKKYKEKLFNSIANKILIKVHKEESQNNNLNKEVEANKLDANLNEIDGFLNNDLNIISLFLFFIILLIFFYKFHQFHLNIFNLNK